MGESEKVKLVQSIIKEEVAIALSITLSGRAPFKYTAEAHKMQRCPVCERPFYRKVWWQLYDRRKCGMNRSRHIRTRFFKEHPEVKPTKGRAKQYEDQRGNLRLVAKGVR